MLFTPATLAIRQGLMSSEFHTLDEFLELPTETVREIVYPRRLSISLLLNGTRRWYISSHFDAPPKDNSYLPDLLEAILTRMAHLLKLLADHGLYVVFLPAYSEEQQERDGQAHKSLVKGIVALKKHPALIQTYEESKFGVRFYGDGSCVHEPLRTELLEPSTYTAGTPSHMVYYDVNTGNPHDHLLRLSYEFSMKYRRPPTWQDMLEIYYGARDLKPLDIMISVNRFYARLGIPPLLERKDRIYATVVTPLVLTARNLRRVLYDYLYNDHDRSRSYTEIHPAEIQRLKHFYAANSDTIMGLTRKYEDLVYPLPGPVWPSQMG
jgi:hypothetical protein